MNRIISLLCVLAALSLSFVGAFQVPPAPPTPPPAGCSDQGRCFFVDVQNNMGRAVPIIVTPGPCYEGDNGHATIAAGAALSVGIARIQGNDCNGENGYFLITVDGGYQVFSFTNSKFLSVYTPNGKVDALLGPSFTRADGWTHYTDTLNADWINPQYCQEYKRCPLLYINNNTDTEIKWIIYAKHCYEGTTGTLTVPAGSRTQIWLARVQGHDCDGENGIFELAPQTGIEGSETLSFNNDGSLFVATHSKSYLSGLTQRQNNNAYEYSVDENITHTLPGIPPVAKDPVWNPLLITTLDFTTHGFSPNYYESCAGVEFYHPQHVVRLPNDKNGNAFFMIAQSREHNGYISLLKVDQTKVDPVTDGIIDSQAGEIVWQQNFTGKFNGQVNPIGNWNHPGKMSFVDGVLAVSAQNWKPNGGMLFGCGKWFDIMGTSEDAVLFYDVRDPTNPKYMGKMLASQLGVPAHELAEVELTYNTQTQTYLLDVGGAGKYPVFTSSSLNALFDNWQKVPDAPHFSGQHGSVYERGPSPAQLVYFDASKTNSKLTMSSFTYLAKSPFLVTGPTTSQGISLPGANRDWDTSSLYVSSQGKPIIYSVKCLGGDDYQVYQIMPPVTK